MFCASCGEKIDNSGKYCPHCGKKIQKRQFIDLSLLTIRLKPIVSVYRRYILPHRSKIAKYLPAVCGVFTAAMLMVTIILPAYGSKMYEQGKDYIAKAQYGKAVSAFNQAGIAGIKNSEIDIYKSQAYIGLENYEQAKKILGENSEKSDPAHLKLLADVWHYEGNKMLYEAALSNLVSLTPNDPYAYLRLSDFYREEGLYDNASGILEKLLGRQKSSLAAAKVYNIYMESYLNSTASDKAEHIKDDAMKALSSAKIEYLNIEDSIALSLSPSGKFLASLSGNDKAVEIYGLDNSAFIYHSSFAIPAGYEIDPGMIAWSCDESMLAFSNSNAEEYVHDSSIYIYDLAGCSLKNLTDPKEDYVHYMAGREIYLIDSLPCFSADSESLYFSRKSVKGNWLCKVDLDGENLTHLFEPADGGWVDYKIMERKDQVYFSVRGHEKSDTWGIYTYDEANGARRLKFDYDSRYYHLALKDMTKDGRYLLYYLSISSQNDSMYFGVLDLESMKLSDIYKQDIDSYNNKLSAINRSNIFGASRIFVTRNAGFSLDGKSVYIAENGADAYGKTIRRFPLEGGNGDFAYISFEKEGAETFCIPNGNNKSGAAFFEISDGKFLINDKGLRLLSINGGS